MHARPAKPLFLNLLLAATLLFAAAAPAGAQYLPRPFSGAVKVARGTFPSQRVEVQLLNQDGRPRERVFTDSNGNFQLTTLRTGSQYIIRIEVEGYKRIEQTVETSMLQPTLTTRVFMLEMMEAAPKHNKPESVSAERLRAPKEARDALEKGERELDRRNYAKAVEHLDKALAAAPELSEALYHRGVAALQMNEPAAARGYFEKAVAANADYGEALIGLGAALSREGNAQGAMEPLTQGLSLVPKSYLGLFERCRANLNLGNAEAALADCEGAQANADGARPELMVLQGNLYLRLNRNPEALREFQEYLKIDSSSPTATAVKDLVERMKKAGIKAA